MGADTSLCGTVGSLIERKGSQVVQTRQGERVGDVARLLTIHDIGAVIVVDGLGRLVGIVSERDVVRLLGTHGPDALRRTVAEAMTRDVVVCDARSTLAEAMGLMATARIRHLPVVVEGVIGGIVSIRDIVETYVSELEVAAAALADYVTGSSY